MMTDSNNEIKMLYHLTVNNRHFNFQQSIRNVVHIVEYALIFCFLCVLANLMETKINSWKSYWKLIEFSNSKITLFIVVLTLKWRQIMLFYYLNYYIHIRNFVS